MPSLLHTPLSNHGRHTMAITPVFLAAVLPQLGRVTTACRAIQPTGHTVIELYTSEGCSSCPPPDQWLSALKGTRAVVVQAFHVGYWELQRLARLALHAPAAGWCTGEPLQAVSMHCGS